MTKTRQDNNETEVHVQPTSKTILNFRDWSDRVLTMKKSRQDNDVTYRIGLVYAKIET